MAGRDREHDEQRTCTAWSAGALGRRGWALASGLVIGIRLDFALSDAFWESVVVYLGASTVLLVILGYATKFYRGRYLVGSYDEAFGLAAHMATVAAATLLPPCACDRRPRAAWWRYPAPRPAVLGGRTVRLPLAVRPHGHAGTRADSSHPRVRRRGRWTPGRPAAASGQGPGRRAHRRQPRQAAPPHQRRPGRRDADAPGGRSRRARRGRRDLRRTVGRAVIGTAQEAAQRAGLDFLVLPRVSADRRTGHASDIRPVEISDVLGRHQVLDQHQRHRRLPHGRRVLITGAGGSIGAELARQVHRFGPSQLVLSTATSRRCTRSASPSTATACSTAATRCWPTSVTTTGLAKVFSRHRPEIVFHAAALKHLPMLERFPARGGRPTSSARSTSRAHRRARRRALREHLHRQGRRRRRACWAPRSGSPSSSTAWHAADGDGAHRPVRQRAGLAGAR